MLNNMYSVAWSPVEAVGWTRKALGYKIVHESQGGTLKTLIDQKSMAGGQLHLQADLEGRVLAQVYCNGELVFEQLMAHDPLDAFIELAPFSGERFVEVELHLIPAACCDLRVPQHAAVIGSVPRGTDTVEKLARKNVAGWLNALAASMKVPS